MTDAFNTLAQRAAAWSGSAWFFIINVGVIVAWAISGTIYGWPNIWQLLLTTALTITTQLMVILIQATQNRDGRAMHLKLDEVLRSIDTARTELARAEEMSEGEIEEKIEEIKKEGP